MERSFAFKELKAWQKSMEYANSIISLIEDINTIRKHYRLVEQLESCSASVPLNIAEGKGRNTDKEFMRFLYISRGSLYESVSLLYLFNKRSWISNEDLEKLEEQAFEIARMIKGLINSLNSE